MLIRRELGGDRMTEAGRVRAISSQFIEGVMR